jgi:hypothetical protein
MTFCGNPPSSPLGGLYLTTCCKERLVSGVSVQVSVIKNFKSQITKTKQITITEIQNPKQLAFDLI